mgnify:CR=1 FL=1
MKIMKNRIYNQLDLNWRIEQAGIRKNQSTIDHLQVINQLIEKSPEYQMVVFQDRTIKELKVRRNKAWGKFWSPNNQCIQKQKIGIKIKDKNSGKLYFTSP